MDNLIHQANNRRLTGEIFQVLDELVITLAGKLVAELIILRGGLVLFPGLQCFADIALKTKNHANGGVDRHAQGFAEIGVLGC